MAFLTLAYAPEDTTFAEQLAVQLQQRGLDVQPTPDLLLSPDELYASQRAALKTASHVLVVLSPDAVASEPLQREYQRLTEREEVQVVVVLCRTSDMPSALKPYPLVDFRDRFLLSFEELIKLLKKLKTPKRPITAEPPPPVAKPELLPASLPSERCWREDRLRINYRLPLVMTKSDLSVRLPAFFVRTGFKLVRTTNKGFHARRLSPQFGWFDPRHTHHTLSIKRRKGALQVRYQMTRRQAAIWLPAHYRVMDREAAALLRYLAMEELEGVLEPVRRQARRAQRQTWLSLVAIIVVTLGISYAVLLALLGLW
jgi:hypothetical protein